MVAAILVSPYLVAIAIQQPTDISSLSEVGQAYGGVSAILSGIAILSVAATLAMQSYHVKVARVFAERQAHFNLMVLAFENPDLCALPDPLPECGVTPRQAMFTNLWMGYWYGIWDVGDATDEAIQLLVSNMFKNRISRNWWGAVRGDWGVGQGKDSEKFHSLVNSEWHRASAYFDQLDACDTPAAATSEHALPHRSDHTILLAGSAVCAVAVGAVLWRQRSRPWVNQ